MLQILVQAARGAAILFLIAFLISGILSMLGSSRARQAARITGSIFLIAVAGFCFLLLADWSDAPWVTWIIGCVLAGGLGIACLVLAGVFFRRSDLSSDKISWILAFGNALLVGNLMNPIILPLIVPAYLFPPSILSRGVLNLGILIAGLVIRYRTRHSVAGRSMMQLAWLLIPLCFCPPHQDINLGGAYGSLLTLAFVTTILSATWIRQNPNMRAIETIAIHSGAAAGIAYGIMLGAMVGLMMVGLGPVNAATGGLAAAIGAAYVATMCCTIGMVGGRIIGSIAALLLSWIPFEVRGVVLASVIGVVSNTITACLIGIFYSDFAQDLTDNGAFLMTASSVLFGGIAAGTYLGRARLRYQTGIA
jgi:hypothetical protein